MSDCLVCGSSVVRRRKYCSVECYYQAKIDRKRTTYQTDSDARSRQLVRLKARTIKERKPCSVCGAEKAEKHHESYARPFDVIWLCRKHHLEYHRKGKGMDAMAYFGLVVML